MTTDQPTRKHLLNLLRGGGAHMSFDDAVVDFPLERINERPPNVPYTIWHLLDHLRFTQRDIIDYVNDPDYVAPPWPRGYWPERNAETDVAGWEKTIADFRADLGIVISWTADANSDLYAPLSPGGEHTLLRQILLVADHNAYHVGEFGILRQVMGTWPQQRI